MAAVAGSRKGHEAAYASAVLAGEEWAQAVRDSLLSESRLPEGGWPGTLGEALVRAHNLPADVLPPEMLADLARTLNDAARRRWLRAARPRRANSD